MLATDKKSHACNWSKKSHLQQNKKVTLATSRKTQNWSNIKHSWSKNSPFYNWSKNGQLFEYQAQLIECLSLQLIEKQTNDWSSTTDEKVTL